MGDFKSSTVRTRVYRTTERTTAIFSDSGEHRLPVSIVLFVHDDRALPSPAGRKNIDRSRNENNRSRLLIFQIVRVVRVPSAGRRRRQNAGAAAVLVCRRRRRPE